MAYRVTNLTGRKASHRRRAVNQRRPKSQKVYVNGRQVGANGDVTITNQAYDKQKDYLDRLVADGIISVVKVRNAPGAVDLTPETVVTPELEPTPKVETPKVVEAPEPKKDEEPKVEKTEEPPKKKTRKRRTKKSAE